MSKKYKKIMTVDISAVKQFLANEKDILLIQPVKKVNNKGKEENSVIVATQSSLFYVNPGKKMSADKKSCWLHLTAITLVEYQSKFICKFTHGKNETQFTFITAEYINVAQTIGGHLQRLMGPYWSQKMNIDLLTKEKFSFDSASVLMRLNVYCQTEGISVPEKYITKLQKYLDQREINFYFADWDEYIVPIVFALQPYSKCISGVFNKQLSSATFNKLREMFIPFKHICFETPLNADSIKFLEIAKFECTSMEFKNNDLTGQQLPTITQCGIKNEIQSLSLNNAFNESAYQVFYTDSFFKTELCTGTTYFNFDHTHGLHLPRLLWFVKGLTILSFADTGLEVSHAIQQIFGYDFTCLRCLNLSGNVCHETVTDRNKLRIPGNLCRLDINDVEFGRSCVQDFLEFIFGFDWKLGLRLYANNLVTHSGDLAPLFELFDRSPFANLVDFSWCGNQARLGLLHFIKRNKKLANLFIDGCFGEKSPAKIGEFANSIIDMQFLTLLTMRGNENVWMGEAVAPIIEALKGMVNISYVDLSNNKLNERVVEGIYNAVSINASIRTVILENPGIPDDLCRRYEKETDKVVFVPKFEKRDYNAFPKYLTTDELVSPKSQNSPYDAFIFMPEAPPEPGPEEDPMVAKRRKLFLKTVGHNEVDEDLLPITRNTNDRVPTKWELPVDIVENAVFDATDAEEALNARFTLSKLSSK